VAEYEENDTVYFEYRCLECGRSHRVGFRLDLSDLGRHRHHWGVKSRRRKTPMTESEWWSCREPREMLMLLERRGRASDRKLRLFACACCRRAWHLLLDERSRRAVEIAEQWADGLSSQDELVAAYSANEALRDGLPTGWPVILRQEGLASAAAAAAHAASSEAASLGDANGETSGFHPHYEARAAADRAARALALTGKAGQDLLAAHATQGRLLSDIFGPLPFRPLPPVDRTWLDWGECIVRRLAEEAYEQRELPAGTLDPTRLAVLADALEDAGCGDELLAHLRGPGPHLRGCWVIDALTARG
jgi:hypothetical protein